MSSDIAVASAAPTLSVGVSTTSVVPVPSSNVAPMSVAPVGADTRATYASLGAPLPSAPPVVDTKTIPLVGNGTSASAPLPPTQVSAVGSLGQTPGVVAPVAAPAAPTVVIKQLEPVRPYTGTTSYKQGGSALFRQAVFQFLILVYKQMFTIASFVLLPIC